MSRPHDFMYRFDLRDGGYGYFFDSMVVAVADAGKDACEVYLLDGSRIKISGSATDMVGEIAKARGPDEPEDSDSGPAC